MPFSPEELERDRLLFEEEERLRKAAEAAARSKPKPPQSKGAAAPSQNNNRSKQIEQAAQTATKKERNRGVVTQVGETVDNVISGDWLNDGLNAVAAGINAVTPDDWITKGATQALDDNIRSSAELEAQNVAREQQVAQEGSFVEKAVRGTATNLEAVAEGMEGGINLPATIAARLTNNASPWADPPAVLKDSPIGETVFEVAQILTPTLLTGGVAAGLGAPAVGSSLLGLAGESFLETATQDSFDDLLAGRTLAGKFGEIADHLGYDGEAFARELVEGETANSQVLTAVVGFVQNYGIIFGADRLVRFFGKPAGKALRGVSDEATDKAAQILGKSSDDVDKALGKVNEPLYSKDLEPHEAMDIDNAVPVSKPSGGSEFLGKEALVAEAIRPGIAEDSVSNAGRQYFTNWGAVVDDNSLQRVLQEATSTLKRLKGFPDDMKMALGRASEFWENNRALLAGDLDDLDAAAVNFADLTKTLESKEGIKALMGSNLPVEAYLREYAAVTEEGFVAASLIGEELGVRIQKMASQALNLDTSGVDFSDAIENLIQLHEKSQMFLIPLRRGKRKWAVEGTLQQKKQLKRVKDADIRGAIKKGDQLSSDAPSRSFQTIKGDDADPGLTLRELWEKYQGGDDAAGATLKRYLNLITYTDSSSVLSQVSGLNTALRDALKKGNSEATTNLFYFSMLSRAATQTASAASNFARLIAEPLGAMMTKDKAYGWGQLVGGWQGLSDSHKVFKKALLEGKATNGGAKLDDAVKDLVALQAKEDKLYEAAVKEANEAGIKGIQSFPLHIAHWWRTAGNHPLVHAPGRLLMAGDEWTKSVTANQVAIGRAYKEIAEKGITDLKLRQEVIDKHIKNVFRGSVRTGKIVDADVLSVAQHLTFQSAIPTEGGNAVDAAFSAINQAAQTSGFWKFVSPFTRVSYNILETTARYEPTGVFRAVVPKYQKILSGGMGETAQLQLKSQIRFGQAWASMAVLGAGTGFITGVNSGNLPKQSFIIPANNEDGYIAIPYGKLEPFATITSVIADVVNGFKNEVISEGDYEKFVSNIVFSLGMASFDKTFMTGMADFGSMFDAKNLSSGSLRGAANITSAVSPGVVRMITSWAHPYRTISGMDANAWETFVGSWRARAIGGIGNPVLYDELSGKPIPTVATIGKGDNYWALVLGSAFNEFAYPGKVTKAPKDDAVRSELDWTNFTHDTYSSIRTYNGVALTPTQQSVLSKDMHDFGNLRGKLQRYFDSNDYKRLKSELNAMRKADSAIGSSDVGTRAGAVRDLIHQDLRAIWRGAKEDAIRYGRLQEDPEFMLKATRANRVGSLTPPTSNSGYEGLLAWTNK